MVRECCPCPVYCPVVTQMSNLSSHTTLPNTIQTLGVQAKSVLLEGSVFACLFVCTLLSPSPTDRQLLPPMPMRNTHATQGNHSPCTITPAKTTQIYLKYFLIKLANCHERQISAVIVGPSKSSAPSNQHV